MRPPKIRELQIGQRIVVLLAEPGNRAWTAAMLAQRIGRGVSAQSAAQACARLAAYGQITSTPGRLFTYSRIGR